MDRYSSRTGTRRNALKGLAGRSGRYGDLLLAALLVVVVALFVLPLPTSLLDLLIGTNLAISLLLLIVAMYAPSALSLSTFPSLLLFTTLFRLALNIASTKLILLHAHAGQIIETFGKLIVGNNVVVGGVVFLIIAIVQFIVIAKGSERVAEVAARFALDAMPGKQMSIDADVRAGVLSTVQAQKRRRQLEEESQLHGAMDGAMKFVKGDAIASIVIAIVNIVAGLAIGTMMHDMSLGGALQRYAILTVGDGMVSQIPSLLVSISAGVVITRVGTGDVRDAQLASQIGRQLVAHPRALVIAGIAVCSFLLVPGFPKLVFGFLGLALITIGLTLRTQRRKRQTPSWISLHETAEALASQGDHALTVPVAVRLAEGLRESIDTNALDLQLASVKIAVEKDLGPIFPRLQVSYEEAFPPDEYAILLHDVEVARGALKAGAVMLDSDGGAMQAAESVIAAPFGPFSRVVWIPDGEANEPVLRHEEVIARHLDDAVRRNARNLIGLQEVQRLLQAIQRDAPDLAAEVPRVMTPQRIAEVLRRLVQEGIPIRNLTAIFESLVIWGGKEQDAVALTELVRIDLGRFITSRYAGAGRQLEAILFESSLLERVQNAIERSPRGNLLLLSPAVTQDIRDQLRRILGGAGIRVVAIASSDVRRYVKTLIEPVAPHLPVLSYQEIDDDVALQPVGWVTNPAAA